MLALLRWYRGIRYLRQIRPYGDRTAEKRPRHLLVDVSVLRRVDSRTGIQRVVRALLVELTKMMLTDMVVQPVFATRKEPYRYCDLTFLNRSLSVQAPSAGMWVSSWHSQATTSRSSSAVAISKRRQAWASRSARSTRSGLSPRAKMKPR